MIRTLSRRSLWIVGLLALSSMVAVASEGEISDEAYAMVNGALIEHHVLPRFERLAVAADDLAQSTEYFCTGSGQPGLDNLRKRYHAAMDAWMGVQHLRFGPSELFMRASRLYFWPEARGRVADAVRASLEDADDPTSERLAKASVAIQGLPATEYLLYSDGGPAQGLEKGSRGCLLLVSVTHNMRNMANGIVTDWQGGHIDFKRLFLETGSDNPYYDGHRAAALDLFKSFHAGLQLITDVRLKPVIGESISTAKPGLVESRLSGRSLRNVVINLEALEALYLGEGGAGLSELVSTYGGDHKLDALMRKALGITIQTARGIDHPLESAVVDEVMRPKVEQLLTQVVALKQIVKMRVATALGLTVGFNALDGD